MDGAINHYKSGFQKDVVSVGRFTGFMWTEGRLRVVPHFSSGIVERAKRERA